MTENWVIVPPTGPVDEAVIDRRTNQSWIVHVEPFELATTVVTQLQWTASLPTPPSGEDRPQVGVSWRDAVLFCNELSRRQGLTPVYDISTRPVEKPTRWRPHSEPARDEWVVTWDQAADGYRLPTDAEWQVACRAGSKGPRYAPLPDVGWYQDNSNGQLPLVGVKLPNRWGLHDMLGGVWEWCWDLFDEDVYGPYRIIRGGGWNDPHWSCRAGVRRKTNPVARFDDLGFRLARNAVSSLGQATT